MGPLFTRESLLSGLVEGDVAAVRTELGLGPDVDAGAAAHGVVDLDHSADRAPGAVQGHVIVAAVGRGDGLAASVDLGVIVDVAGELALTGLAPQPNYRM